MPHGHREYFYNVMYSVRKKKNTFKHIYIPSEQKYLFEATSNDTPQRFAGEIDAEANLET